MNQYIVENIYRIYFSKFFFIMSVFILDPILFKHSLIFFLLLLLIFSSTYPLLVGLLGL